MIDLRQNGGTGSARIAAQGVLQEILYAVAVRIGVRAGSLGIVIFFPDPENIPRSNLRNQPP